jgi:probable HAF family extracellular repeat protein
LVNGSCGRGGRAPPVCAAAAAALLAGARAPGQCEYEVTIIEPHGCGIFSPPSVVPQGINRQGHVVGYDDDCPGSDDPEDAFFWSVETGYVTIDTGLALSRERALDINDAGLVVGSYEDPSNRFKAFLHDGRSMIDLGTLPGDDQSEALAINAAGLIVGYSHNPATGPLTACLWEDGAIRDLTPSLRILQPSAQQLRSVASDISDRGAIVGWMRSGSGPLRRAFLLDGRTVIDLGVVPGGYSGEARAVNNRNQVVGVGRVGGMYEFTRHSFLWDQGRMIDLGTMPGSDYTFALDINDAGQVIGYYRDEVGYTFGFIWQDGLMRDLGGLICGFPDAIVGPKALNDNGQIAGGIRLESGWVAVLLTPVARPAADLDADGIVGITDLLLLLRAWGPCPACTEDLDGDGEVGRDDLAILLKSWS